MKWAFLSIKLSFGFIKIPNNAFPVKGEYFKTRN